MLREGVAVGVLALTRSAVRPFSDEQIALVENFAAQAVIAIENARLLNELRQRTTTSGTHQTYRGVGAADRDLRCTQVISGSPGDLQPVFDTMLANATRLCEATRHCGHSMANKCTPSRCGVMRRLSNGCGSHNPFGQSPGVRQSVFVQGSASFMWLIGAGTCVP